MCIILNACVGSSSSEDPYNRANNVLKQNSSLSVKSNLFGKAYGFSKNNCYKGMVVDNICSYTFEDKSILIINAGNVTFKGVNKSYAISNRSHLRIGEHVFILDENNSLWICDLVASTCSISQGKYLDILAVDIDKNIVENSAENLEDLLSYRSVLLLSEPTHDSTSNPIGFRVKSELLQLFISKGEKPSNATTINNEYGAFVISRNVLTNDVVVASDSIKDGVGDIVSLSFGLVGLDYFNIQFIYKRPNNKGSVYQYYLGGLNYGMELLQKDISKNTKRTNKNHLTIFNPTLEEPLSFNMELRNELESAVRTTAGGSQDTGDYYAFCSGYNTFCNLSLMTGYSAIASQNYVTDIINNASIFGFSVIASTLGIVGSKQIIKVIGKNSGKIFSILKYSAYVLPVVSDTSIMLGIEALSDYINNGLFKLTTDKPVEEASMSNIAIAFLNGIKSYYFSLDKAFVKGPDRNFMMARCIANFADDLTNYEKKLKNKSLDLIRYETLYDLYLAHNFNSLDMLSSDSKSNNNCKNILEEEQISFMKQIRVFSYPDFKSSVISWVFGKLYIQQEDDNTNDFSIDINDMDIFNNEEGKSNESEMPLADIIIKIPNCFGSCETAYLLHRNGERMKDKDGKEIAIFSGNYKMLNYMRTDTNFKLPFFSNLWDKYPPYLNYNINAYQISNLSCEKLNQQIAKVTGNINNNYPVYAQIHDRDKKALIIDKNGKACNSKEINYKDLVFRYDNTLVSDLFALVPTSPSPGVILADYVISLGIGSIGEVMRINDHSPENYQIRDARLVSGELETSPYKCKQIEVNPRNKDEKFKQIALGKSEYGGLWVIGNMGLHFIDSENKLKQPQYNFDFNGSQGAVNAVTVTDSGKLVIAGVSLDGTGLGGANMLSYYNELELLQYANENPQNSNYRVNLGKQFGQGVNREFTNSNISKIYSGKNIHLSSSNPEEFIYGLFSTNNVSVWSTLSPFSSKATYIENLPGYQITPNIAITRSGYVKVLQGSQNKIQNIIPYAYSKVNLNHSANDKPSMSYANAELVFAIDEQAFSINQEGNVFDENGIFLQNSKIPLFYSIIDALGSDNGKFYILNEQNLYGCTMSNDKLNSKKLNIESIKLKIENNTGIDLNVNTTVLDDRKTLKHNLNYLDEYPNHLLSIKINSNSSYTIELSGAVELSNFLNRRLFAIFNNGARVTDRDYLTTKVGINGELLIDSLSYGDKLSLNIIKSSDSEYRIKVAPKSSSDITSNDVRPNSAALANNLFIKLNKLKIDNPALSNETSGLYAGELSIYRNGFISFDDYKNYSLKKNVEYLIDGKISSFGRWHYSGQPLAILVRVEGAINGFSSIFTTSSAFACGVGISLCRMNVTGLGAIYINQITENRRQEKVYTFTPPLE